jgi:hypothetical protein
MQVVPAVRQLSIFLPDVAVRDRSFLLGMGRGGNLRAAWGRLRKYARRTGEAAANALALPSAPRSLSQGRRPLQPGCCCMEIPKRGYHAGELRPAINYFNEDFLFREPATAFTPKNSVSVPDSGKHRHIRRSNPRSHRKMLVQHVSFD